MMAKKLAPKTYTYRQHLLQLADDGWTISGPAVAGTAESIRQAYQQIDRAPGAPAKLDPKNAGRLGAKAFHSKYRLEPYGTSNWAIVDRQTGTTINYLNGTPW